MLGNMMFQPLLISSMIEHAGRYHADTEVISKNTDTTITVTNWGEIHQNSKRFANALQQLGLAQGDRVATIAWNNHRHLESWYAISGSGLVCHTINPRLFPEQLIFIMNDAADRVVLFDKTKTGTVSLCVSDTVFVNVIGSAFACVIGSDIICGCSVSCPEPTKNASRAAL